MKHGGDILSYQSRTEHEIIDFSSNINPLGCPKGLRQVLCEAFGDITSYPDIKYRRLKKNISQYLRCSDSNVIVGSGAVEIIDNIIAGFERIVVPIPCFGEYLDRARIRNKHLITIPMHLDFALNFDVIEQNLVCGDLLILGNPNNPTGKRIDRELLIKIHNLVKERRAFLLLDEAFYEFCEEDYDSIELFRQSEAVCIIRAATKFFALPGIRLGYAFTSEAAADEYNEKALPWNINTFADAASTIIFNDHDFIHISKEYIKVQRNWMLSDLKKVSGIQITNTDCNFILIKLLINSEEEVFDFLLGKGIMTRKASSFQALDNSFIRVAIKSEQDNIKLVACLDEYFSNTVLL